MTRRILQSACGLAAVVAVALGVAAANADTICVDDDAPTDPEPGDCDVSDPDEDGSLQHPFDAIQEGINAAHHFDTVLVRRRNVHRLVQQGSRLQREAHHRPLSQ
ncbi:MAG TPA: hypothetical protein VM487_00380 [Phycisphaerae bacterium]|nr:hypothetical protein [Phycisphaerae bacterium]